jgi:YVTN family beta-propeller protein
VSTDTRIGTELRGYRIESLLGRGGMSVVYLAEHLRLGRKVALKLLTPELAENQSFRERFLRESRLAASIDHPNIIPVYDADEADGVLYIAMRFVEGTDLKVLLRREGRLQPSRAAAILRQVADALDVAHERGLVHRDVKPANVLIARRGGHDHCYLSDFGLTKQAASISGLTGTGQLVGTVDYAAPEQIKGDPVDTRADVYSLGCVLYECLTGFAPYRRDTEMAVLWAHVQEPPPTLSAERPELRALDPVLAKAMAKLPDDRFSSAGELSDAFGAEIGLTPREARAPLKLASRPEQLLAQTKALVRRRARIVVPLAVLVLVAIVAAVALVARGGSSAKGPITVGVNSVGIIDPKTNRVVGQVTVGNNPGDIAFGNGSAWVPNNGDNTISRIDQRSLAVVHSFAAGAEPRSVAVGSGAVWAFDAKYDVVERINPASDDSLDASIGLGGCAPRACGGDLAVGNGAVWATNFWRQTVVRISPGTNQVVRKIQTANSQNTIAFGEGGVWTESALGVLRFDPHTLRIVDRIRIPNQPTEIAAGAGAVWVACEDDDVVWRVDPESDQAVRTIPVGHRPAGITVGDGAVWVANNFAGTISRIDPNTNSVVATIHIGHSPVGVAVGDGLVWVTVQAP